MGSSLANFLAIIAFGALLGGVVWLRLKLKDALSLKSGASVAAQGVLLFVLMVALGSKLLPLNLGIALVSVVVMWLMVSMALYFEENVE